MTTSNPSEQAPQTDIFEGVEYFGVAAYKGRYHVIIAERVSISDEAVVVHETFYSDFTVYDTFEDAQANAKELADRADVPFMGEVAPFDSDRKDYSLTSRLHRRVQHVEGATQRLATRIHRIEHLIYLNDDPWQKPIQELVDELEEMRSRVDFFKVVALVALGLSVILCANVLMG